MFGRTIDIIKVVPQVESFFQKWKLTPERVTGGTWLVRGVGTYTGGRNIDVWVRVIPDAEGTLIFESFTNFLPDPAAPNFSPGNMTALFRDLLELSAGPESGDAYFGLKELPTGQTPTPTVISVEIRRPIRGLDFQEFQRCLTHVATLADENDERLTREYNAPKIRMQ